MTKAKTFTNAELKSLIRQYKTKNCLPYSKLNKKELIQYILKVKKLKEVYEKLQSKKDPMKKAQPQITEFITKEPKEKTKIPDAVKKMYDYIFKYETLQDTKDTISKIDFTDKDSVMKTIDKFNTEQNTFFSDINELLTDEIIEEEKPLYERYMKAFEENKMLFLKEINKGSKKTKEEQQPELKEEGKKKIKELFYDTDVLKDLKEYLKIYQLGTIEFNKKDRNEKEMKKIKSKLNKIEKSIGDDVKKTLDDGNYSTKGYRQDVKDKIGIYKNPIRRAIEGKGIKEGTPKMFMEIFDIDLNVKSEKEPEEEPKEEPKKESNGKMSWREALKKYAEEVGKYIIPKKGSAEYKKVKEIQNNL